MLCWCVGRALSCLRSVQHPAAITFRDEQVELGLHGFARIDAALDDSGFWVITKMSGMTESEGLKYITPMTTCMGLVGLVVTIAGVKLFPMAG